VAYFAIEDFKGGVDTRRSRFTSVAGTLRKAVNGHITRGGDIERRKEFTAKGSIPPETFGLGADIDGIVVFGSTAPGELTGSLPAGVRYQQLAAPGNPEMVSLDAYEMFGGYSYVAATFADGNQWHFFNGDVVYDWNAGVVMPYMGSMNGVAAAIAELINARGVHQAVAVGNVITITGPVGVDYSISGAFDNDSGLVGDQEFVISITRDAQASSKEVRAVGSFPILTGSVSPGVNKVSSVKVGGVELLAAPVDYAVSPQQTAADVAAAINTGGGGYTAYSQSSVVFIRAASGTGSSLNEVVVEATSAGDVLMFEGGFTVIGAGGGSFDMVDAAGVPIMSGPVAWAGSNAATAEAIAADIRAFPSVPKYLARAVGETVHVSPARIASDLGAIITIQVNVSGNASSGGGSPPPVYNDPNYPTDPNDRRPPLQEP
jgi:hypothetical protein